MAIFNLTADNFNDIIYDNDFVMIDFYRPSCPSSKELDPILRELEKKHTDVAFAFCNIDEVKEVVSSFALTKTPTLAMFNRQNLAYQQAGVPFEDELDELIGRVKKLDMDTLLGESEDAEE